MFTTDEKKFLAALFTKTGGGGDFDRFFKAFHLAITPYIEKQFEPLGCWFNEWTTQKPTGQKLNPGDKLVDRFQNLEMKIKI